MKHIFLVILVLFSLPLHAQKSLGDGTRDLATQITASAAKLEKQRIAVLPFHELDGQPTVLGTYLAEELVTNLFQLGNFKIVERQLLDKVMGELRIEQSGAIDPKTAKEIGRIAAVDAIVTGSITELESFVSVNCRLIDTTTGEVFGAAQTKIAKDDDVRKIMAIAIAPGSPTASGNRRSYQAASAIATKDIGSLRVVLKSVMPMTLTPASSGQRRGGLRCVFEFINREAQRQIVVAINAQELKVSTGVSFGPRDSPTYLRATLLDDRGDAWSASATSLTGVGFVRAGTSAVDGFWVEKHESYSPTDIVNLLDRWDRLGSNLIVGKGIFDGDTFVSGSTTVIDPAASIRVTIDFVSVAQREGEPKYFQISSEIVVGVVSAGGRKSYSLQNVTFDQVSIPSL